MYKAKIDLPVLLIFFTRPDTLKEVFASVKEARPTKLFLACDGPREGNEIDRERIEECKKVVSDIDWECEVFTRYSEENQGCGKGPMNAISWAFEHTDRLLILEDDCVANQTLYPFMKEMLDKYSDDERVGIISGFNHFKEWDCGGYSYAFTKSAATLGWGTWKRVWDKYDYNVREIDNEYHQKLLLNEIIHKRAGKSRIGSWMGTFKSNKEKDVNYWDVQFGFVKYSQSYLCVVPSGNLIYNNGVGAGSTHTAANKKVKWKLGKILFMPTVDMKFPLVHPKLVICDREYDNLVFEKIHFPGKFVKYVRKIKRRVFKIY